MVQPGDLVSRIQHFAAGYGAVVVSSAYLSAELDVDVRTIAAALRRHGVRPQDVGSTRGYVVADLVALPVATAAAEVDPPVGVVAAVQALADEWRDRYVMMNPEPSAIEVPPAGAGHGVWPQDVGDTRGYVVDELVALPGVDVTVMPQTPQIAYCAICNSPVDVSAGRVNTCHPVGALLDGPVPRAEAIAALSAGAGHDMTPALKAAGLL